METAPLTNAHALARDALRNPPKSALAAAEKHKIVADEFAKAADGVDDSEALRVLNLLEQHHQRLAQIISSASERSGKDSAIEAVTEENSELTLSSTASPNAEPPGNISLASTSGQSRGLQRKAPREMSSSIATNLATARGIPKDQQRKSQQLSPTSTRNERKESDFRGPGKQTALEASKGRKEHQEGQTQKGFADASNPSANQRTGTLTEPEANKTESDRTNDDPFHKFYATFEGLLTKLSAPLAFAGLPLVPEEKAEAKATSTAGLPKTTTTSELTTTSPEVSRIFSKAALRAVKEEHGGAGVQESFLVVPTGGGTVSYAGILSRAERQARHHALETPLEYAEEGPEHFVDAQESPEMRSSRIAKQASAASGSSLTKTAEELQVENESLKQLTDNLSRRLYMWEKSSQTQSMALQQSILNLQPPAHAPSGTGGDEKNGDHDERLRDLEEQFMAAQRELERYGRENEKLRTVVMRYRERWEKLKEGARVRREGAERGADTPPVES